MFTRSDSNSLASTLGQVFRFDFTSTLDQGLSNVLSHLILLFWFLEIRSMLHDVILSPRMSLAFVARSDTLVENNPWVNFIIGILWTSIHLGIIETWTLLCPCWVISRLCTKEQLHILTFNSRARVQYQQTRVVQYSPRKTYSKGTHSACNACPHHDTHTYHDVAHLRS